MLGLLVGLGAGRRKGVRLVQQHDLEDDLTDPGRDRTHPGGHQRDARQLGTPGLGRMEHEQQRADQEDQADPDDDRGREQRRAMRVVEQQLVGELAGLALLGDADEPGLAAEGRQRGRAAHDGRAHAPARLKGKRVSG